MKKSFVPLILLFVLVQPLFAQKDNMGWEKWQYLLGEWKGEGSGQPGQGSGTFSFQTELGGNILVRKSHTEFPANGTKPAALHEDLMVVYKTKDGNPVKAIYFDNEKHVISYDITYSENKIVLTSEASSAMPRFRLIYEKLENNLVNTRFELAMPNAPENFKMYIEGKSRKVN